jgi:type I restriction enzyme S subunit
MTTNQGFLNFRCGPRLRPLYLAYWLRANGDYLGQVANGSTYPELYVSDLFEIVAGVPPLEEQDAILSWIRAVQFLAQVGVPLEQSVASPQEMVRFQAQTRRIRALGLMLSEALLAGEIRVGDFAPPLAALA